MKLEVTNEASKWFANELDVSEGDSVQLYARYGGKGSFQVGFSLGITVSPPVDPGLKIEKNGVTYFVEKKDEWYLDKKDLKIDVNQDTGEIEFLHESK